MVMGASTVESQTIFTVSPTAKASFSVGEVMASKPAVWAATDATKKDSRPAEKSILLSDIYFWAVKYAINMKELKRDK